MYLLQDTATQYRSENDLSRSHSQKWWNGLCCVGFRRIGEVVFGRNLHLFFLKHLTEALTQARMEDMLDFNKLPIELL